MSVRLMTAVFDHPMPDLSVEKDGASKTIKASTVKLVLLALADCANDEGKGAYPSIGTLAKKTAIRSRTTLVDCLDALQEAGYISYAGRSEYNTANYTLHMGALNSPASGLSQKEESPASAHAKVQPVEKKSPASGLKPSVNPSVKPSVKDSGEAAPDPWEQEFSPEKPEPIRVPVGQEFESPKRKKDERQVHPAAKLYRQRMHLYVNRDWVDELIRVVGDTPENLARWDELLRAWNGHGWKPGNIVGMLDAFKAGGIGGRGAKNTGGIKYNAEEAKRKALEVMGAG
jgi:hypothetical protein